MQELVNSINEIVWGVPMIVLIISTGVYFTVRSGFFQLRRIKLWLSETACALLSRNARRSDGKGISQFQAMSTALAATIGTGNIAGVATAIAAGGAGAVFWMWVSAFFGMMTSFAENVLGIYYRKKSENGEWCGGAMYYISEGLGNKKGLKRIAKPLAVLFAVFCTLASFGIGNMTQVNSISSALESEFNIPTTVTGIILAVITSLVIVGGIKRIGKVTERLVPIMATFYIVGCLIIFFLNFESIPRVFSDIVTNAFDFSAVFGGVGGYAVMRAVNMGFRRGVFSNEAGLGSSVTVNASSDVKEPVVQGMWGMFEVFFDTIIMCTLTAFVLLSSPSSAVSFEEALSSVSLEPTYFSICEDDERTQLIDCNINPKFIIADETAEAGTYTEYSATTVYGTRLTVRLRNSEEALSEDDFIYTNVMKLTGVQGKNPDGSLMTDENGDPLITGIKISEVDGVPLVAYAFGQKLGGISGKILAIAVVLFAFSTVLGWSCYGAGALGYLFGGKSAAIYRAVYVCFIVVGCTVNLQLVWSISDTLNALMAVPNIIAVLLLSDKVIRLTNNYISRKIYCSGESPLLSSDIGIQREQEKL